MLGVFPTVALEFEWVDWNAGQISAYAMASGVLISAISYVGGWQIRQLVTPTAAPRADDGTPLARDLTGDQPNI